MDQKLIEFHAAQLGVSPTISAFELERVWMRKSYAAKQAGDTGGWEKMRQAYVALQPMVQARELAEAKAKKAQAAGLKEERKVGRLVKREEDEWKEQQLPMWDPRSFTSPWVNLLAVPLVLALAWGVNQLPIAFLLQGFKIWIHEFGHATVAWMSGYKALPLPFGWTNISPAKENFVYWGVLFLWAVFFWAGWKERRFWPMIIAPPLMGVQWHMTWRIEEWQTEQWIDFGGVGGEFYLSAIMIVAFFFELPEKFRWGSCRYLFLFVGALAFLDIYHTWQQIAAGSEEIPWGSMIHGEDDQGGDMNKLRDGWGWSEDRIIANYTQLGQACVVGIGVVYAFFNLRLNRLPIWLIDRLRGVED